MASAPTPNDIGVRRTFQTMITKMEKNMSELLALLARVGADNDKIEFARMQLTIARMLAVNAIQKGDVTACADGDEQKQKLFNDIANLGERCVPFGQQ